MVPGASENILFPWAYWQIVGTARVSLFLGTMLTDLRIPLEIMGVAEMVLSRLRESSERSVICVENGEKKEENTWDATPRDKSCQHWNGVGVEC